MTAYRLVAASLTAWMVAGCGDNVRLEGERRQYVVSELRIPGSTTTARQDGLDLNGVAGVDNQLGLVFGLLEQHGLSVAGTAREALLRGGLVMLAELQTPSFVHAEVAAFTSYLGGDPSPAPCLDPARLETCGQHLLGDGTFSVEETSIADQALGSIDAGVFSHAVGSLPVEIAIDAGTTIRLDLHGARVRLSQISERHISGVLAGGITQADIDGIVIPQALAQIDRIVRAECGQTAGAAPCGCIDGSRADLLQDLFDEDHDCQVELREVARNSLVVSLLTPDVTLDGQPLLSFGVGVELTTATFPSPAE
jgi:hypothetical protein